MFFVVLFLFGVAFPLFAIGNSPWLNQYPITSFSGDITTKEILNRESREYYDLVAEARDQGQPSRSSRVAVKISVLDVNDNAPVIVDPQEDVVSVREEQSPGTEVVRIRATGKFATSLTANYTYLSMILN